MTAVATAHFTITNTYAYKNNKTQNHHESSSVNQSDNLNNV